MTGTLGLFSLLDLFQLLSAAGRSGRLGIEHPDGPARVYFENGQAVHAEFGGRSGEAAVFALFADERGSFEFIPGLPATRRTLSGSTENLVLEAVRRLDESRRTAIATVELDAILDFATDFAGEGGLGLAADELAVLRQVDGRRCLEELARAAALEPGPAQRIAGRLLAVGALRIKGRRPRTARLVTRLADSALPRGGVGVDPAILDAWQRALAHSVTQVACRTEAGEVTVFPVTPVSGAGPFLMISRDDLLRSRLSVDQALLVRPVPRPA